ncbi:DMT family transporter [Cellvibrio sp. KY-GH-1]|uniref:DMT family transporter n=1 Tax=Cellvibrio sp. KY-GH-1 TaxID=2303332 RepID=UPI001248D19F|nr:DMT family transporter [Cellvibrio sp. KY-GH-1]QEY17717.1 DMT family transporter [Cellvibrio sp. KY-GH-1]
MHSPSTKSGYLFATGAVLIWSGFVLVARMGGTSGLNSFDITALRFGVAALVFLPLWWFWKRIPLFNKTVLSLALTGGVTYSIVVYLAFKHAPAAHGAVLISGLLPFFVPLMALLVLKEPLRRNLRFALPVIALGIMCLGVDIFSRSENTLPGDLLLIASSLVWALYTVLAKRSGLDAWGTAIGCALLAALMYLPVYILFLPKAIMQAALSDIVLQGAYQGLVVAVIAMLFYMAAMTRIGPARTGACMAMVPALAGLGASLILGEPLNAWLVTGLLTTSAGAWLGAR